MTGPSRVSRRGLAAAGATTLVGALLGGLPPQAHADPPTACVDGGSCYAALQDAIDAAPDGGTVRLSAGEFAGGVVIERSVRLVGAGTASTTVRGGGPVILALATGDAVPAVRINDLTVTGGLTDGFAGEPGFNALGGGIATLGTSDAGGPTLSLHRVAVTGNTAAPAETYPGDSGVPCPDGDCPYAGAYGGGIFAGGETWIVDSTVSGNLAGGHASDGDGGGIFSTDGELHVIRSVVADNRAAPAPHEIGRFAEGAGIFAAYRGLDLRDSRVSDNVAELITDYPAFAGDGSLIFMAATGGGIHVGNQSPARIVGSQLTGNTVRTINPQGEAVAFDSAIIVANSPLTMRHTLVSDNLAYAESATSVDVGPSGSVLEVDAAARLVETRIVDNRSIAVSDGGEAAISGGLGVFDADNSHRLAVMRKSEISGNVAIARSATGSAQVFGVGVLNNSNLRLADTRVVDNVGRAEAPDATAQGGGIWSGLIFDGPSVDLDLRGARVTGNRLIAPAGTRQGGGLYTTSPVGLTNTTISANRPDDCYGCDGPLTHQTRSPAPNVVRMALPGTPSPFGF